MHALVHPRLMAKCDVPGNNMRSAGLGCILALLLCMKVFMHDFALHKMLVFRCCSSVTSQDVAAFFSAYRMQQCHRGVQFDLVTWSLAPVLRRVCKGAVIMPIKHENNLDVSLQQHRGFQFVFFCMRLYTHSLWHSVTFPTTMCGQLAGGAFLTAVVHASIHA
jgi:hypothetical protein